MRRFNRLRKTARALAKKNGHELGFFERIYYGFPYIHDGLTSVSYYPNTSTTFPSTPSTTATSYVMTTTGSFGPDEWFKARCIYCKKECWINESIDVRKIICVDFYIQQVLKLNARAEANGEKLPMPKRAKGIIFGDCLLSECEQCGV